MNAQQRKNWIIVSATSAVAILVIFPLGYGLPFVAFWVVFLIQLITKRGGIQFEK